VSDSSYSSMLDEFMNSLTCSICHHLVEIYADHKFSPDFVILISQPNNNILKSKTGHRLI
jgi:hypothetical protein